MSRGNRRPGVGLLKSPLLGLTSAIAGAFFLPYALSKGSLTSTITAEGWRVAGLTARQSAQAIHVFESVPVILMALGLASLHARTPGLGSLASTGLSVAIVGYGLTILTHLGEHLLPPLTVPALSGGADWFMWGYYLSWLVVIGGLAVYGVALALADTTPRWIPWLFVLVLPLSGGLGLGMALFDLFTLAGVLRLAQGVTWLAVGTWLWQRPSSTSRTTRTTTADT